MVIGRRREIAMIVEMRRGVIAAEKGVEACE